MTRIDVAYHFRATWRRPRGRAENVGMARRVGTFAIEGVRSEDAPVVARTPFLLDEPWYRLHDGDLWHPMMERRHAQPQAMDAETFGEACASGSGLAPVAARLPSAMVVEAKALLRETPDRREVTRWHRRVPGLSTPFDPGIEDADDLILLGGDEASRRAAIETAMRDYATIDGIVHRRCIGPSIMNTQGWEGDGIHGSLAPFLRPSERPVRIRGVDLQPLHRGLAYPLTSVKWNLGLHAPGVVDAAFRVMRPGFPDQRDLLADLCLVLLHQSEELGRRSLASHGQDLGFAFSRIEAARRYDSGDTTFREFLEEISTSPRHVAEMAVPEMHTARRRTFPATTPAGTQRALATALLSVMTPDLLRDPFRHLGRREGSFPLSMGLLLGPRNTPAPGIAHDADTTSTFRR